LVGRSTEQEFDMTKEIQRGKELVESGSRDEARQYFGTLLTDDANREEAQVWLARLALMAKEPETALEIIEVVLKQNSKQAEALALKGACHMQREEWGKAIGPLEQAKAADPGLAMTYQNLAASYRATDRPAEALEAARKAVSLQPKSYGARFELTHCLAVNGLLDEASNEGVETLNLNPYHIGAYIFLGSLWGQRGEVEAVIDLYKEGLSHNPEAYPLREQLVDLYLLTKNPEAAYEHAEVLVADSGTADDFLKLGKCAILTKKLEKAEEAFKQAAQLAGEDDWRGEYELAELYAAAGLDGEAMERYRAAIQKNDQAFDPVNAFGLLLMRMGDYEMALNFLGLARELAPIRVEGALNLALCYAAMQEYDDAAALAEEVVGATVPGSYNHTEAARLLAAVRRESQLTAQ
jgi:tetratricopeptide (TPR) repeat protein